MSKRIIVIHGRNTKPAKAPYEDLQKRALIQGVTRTDPVKGHQLADGNIPIDFVYYGDINNKLLAKSKKSRKKMTAKDTAFGNAPCIPHDEVGPAIEDLKQIKQYNKAAYSKILKENKRFTFLDDAARIVSIFAAITTATFLNSQVISRATSDMGAYLLTRKTGSDVRKRLQDVLRPALLRGDDICLISHSMGCMVSYDVLWKYSRMSEHTDVQDRNRKVNLWITIGCPLGEAGIKPNLYGGNKLGNDRFPKNIIHDWANFAAVDDFVAHDTKMKDDYKPMRTQKYLNSISDKRIYNCYAADQESNPHKLYGYLGHGTIGRKIADWM